MKFSGVSAVRSRNLLRSGPGHASEQLAHQGVVCGVRVEAIDDPLMRKIRYLDKLIDELAKGKAMEHARGTDGAEAMTPRDPIVEEVRKHRAQIAREHGNDVAAIVAALEGEDAAETTPMVSVPPKRLRKRTTRRRLRVTRRPNKALEPTARD
jgi:hypothetical protein